MADWELFLLRLRYRDGRNVRVSGNAPVLLDDPTAAWVVYSGRVDVFAVPLGPGREAGPRRYLFSAESGDALFGLAAGEHASTLLVSAGPGTQLIRTRVTGLDQLGRAAEFRPLVASLLDGWIGRLSAALIRELPPRAFVSVEAGQPLAVAAGTVVRSRERVLWVQQTPGPPRLLGRPGLPVPDDEQLLPLAPTAWIEAGRRSVLTAQETAALLPEGEVWPHLARFHQLAHQILAAEEARRHQTEADRQAAASHADDVLFESALAQLTQVLAPTQADGLLGEGALDPLFAACQLVAEVQGLQVTRPPTRDSVGGGDPLASIARASRFRTRQVTLRGEWWRVNSGPAVGYLTEDGQPVALLPDAGGYLVFDPAAGTSQRVDTALAGRLRPQADTFYRRFESRALSMRALLAFGLWNCQGDLLRVLLVAIGVGLLAVAMPIATGLLFDVVIPGSHLSLLFQLGAGLALAALVMGAFELVREVALLRLGARFQATLEPAVMDRVLDLPGRFFRDFTAGDLAGRSLAVSAIRDALTGPVLSAVFASMFSGFSLLLLFWYAPRLAVIACLLLVPLALVFVLTSSRLIRQQRLVAEVGGQLSSLVLQLLNGVAKLRVAGAEARAFARWAETFSAQRRAAYATRSIVNRQAVFTASFPVVAMLAVFAVVAASLDRAPSVGAFVAFTTAYAQFVAGALTLLQASSALVQVLPVYERARPILDAAPEVDDTRDDPGELSGAIDVDHVTFRYDSQGPPILDDVSLHCRPGEFIALVGPSGSGKSTLLRLLLGFERAESGAILYDGRDLAALDPRLVRRQIGSVLQNGRLLPGDIVSNIIGSSALTLDDAWEAAGLAGFADDIEQMPMGMHTVIGEGSDTLSGGQRQRLTIARAIVHRPRIVLFDEATSALDNRTQEIVSTSLNGLAATRIVIAHRLSTVVNADRIYVLQHGRIVESGTYRELMQRRGVFAELARRQIA